MPGPDRLLVRFIAVRILGSGGFLVVTSMLIFGIIELSPGDAATQALGPRATQDALAALRADLGLDRPASLRYLEWVGGLLRGDLGRSAVSGRPVSEVLSGPLGRTAALAACAGAGVLVVGVGGGILAGVRAGSRRDRAVSTVALAGLSTPEFVVATALTAVFASGLHWLPAVSLPPSSGPVWDRPAILVLPGVTITVVAGGYLLRLVRSIVIIHASSAHVQAARLDGVGPLTVLRWHLLPAAAGSVAGAVALMVPYLLGGTVVVERVFGYPGLGVSLVSAVATRDQILLQGVAMVLASCTAAAYVLADVTARVLDPYRSSS